jgi:hypothetical protein
MPELKTPKASRKKEEMKVAETSRRFLMPTDLLPETIPPQWIPIKDQEMIDILLSTGQPTTLYIYKGSRIENRQLLPDFNEINLMRDGKGGYYEWYHDNRIGEWIKVHYKNFDEMVTSSMLGMALFMGKKSHAYYDPESKAPGKDILNTEHTRSPRHLGVIFTREKKNPLDVVVIKNDKLKILRTRRLNQYYGEVFLARSSLDVKGKYAVWADGSNTFSPEEFTKKYGYPAKFDLHYHPSYHLALEDYLTRKELKVPVLLQGA